ncbi:PAS domain-containing protein [Nisaea acidiphila]|uniref:PAS domain-containing protein n=1 Tax=Nisaea acidiphila TaxID=1862145 RepID=A0A9J7ASP7_9PROT|nr:PAS domain-containing protein [Nisaea acidiphila]UUX49364.1 PAS domain-containing protein [Nisaea acidiphila]
MQRKQATGIDDLDWVLGYWRSLRRDRIMPSRRDFDPTDIPPKILPHLLLVEVQDGNRFLYRIHGTAHVEAAGWDMTGSYLHELPERGGYRDYIVGIYERLLDEKAPLFTESTIHWKEYVSRSTQRLMMPFSNDGSTVHHVLSVQMFEFVSSDDRLKLNLSDFEGFGETQRYVVHG